MSHPEIIGAETRLASLAEFDFDAADILIRDAMVLARILFTEDSPHLEELAYVTFRPRDVIYNTGHFMNGATWKEGATRMSRILHAMNYEYQLAKQTGPELQVPEQVTFRWLFRHVPMTLWLSFAAIGLTIFLAGYASAKVEFFNHLFALFKSVLSPN